MPAHRSRGVAARAARQASSGSLPHDDRAGHQLAVDGAVVLVRAGSIKPDRIRPAPGHGAAAREAHRADGLDAVRQRSGPGPCDRATYRDRVDSRIRAPVVTTHELDAGAGGHRAHRAASPPPPPPPPPAAVRTRAPVTAASCQRHERKHPDYRSVYTHLNPPQLAGLRELDFSQLTNRKPPGASNFGSPGPGRICSCSSSILFLEQFQHWSAKSPSRRVRDSSITCTIALSVTRASFL